MCQGVSKLVEKYTKVFEVFIFEWITFFYQKAVFSVPIVVYGSNFTNYYKGPPSTQSREHPNFYVSDPKIHYLEQRVLPGKSLWDSWRDKFAFGCISLRTLQFYPCQLSFYRYTIFSHISSGEQQGYRLEDPEFEFRRGKKFISFSNTQTCSGVHPASFSMSTEVLSLG